MKKELRIALVVATVYYATILFFVGSFFDSYEVLFASIVSSEYFGASADYIFLDSNGIPIYLLSKMSSYTQNVPVYGIFLNILNLLSFLLLLYTANTLFGKYGKKKLIIVYILLFVLITPNIISVGITRVAFLFFISTIIYYHRAENKAFLFFTLTILAILRIDAVALSALIYLLFNLLNKNITLKAFFPLLISVIHLTVFNVLLSKYANEAIQSFYYNELEITGKSNIDIKNLSEIDQKKMHFYREHRIMDFDFYTLDFYQRIKKEKGNRFFNAIINPRLLYNNILASQEDIAKSLSIIAISVLFFFTTLARLNIIRALLNISFFFIPAIAATYVSLPPRFLFPYYLFLSFYYLYLNIGILSIRKLKTATLICVVLIGAGLASDISEHYDYQKNFNYWNGLITNIQKENQRDIVVETGLVFVQNNTIIPTTKRNNIYLFDWGYMAGFDNYKKKWQTLCNCNPLSIAEKMKFISDKHIPILISKERVEIYKRYCFDIYGIEVVFSNIESEHTDNLFYITLL